MRKTLSTIGLTLLFVVLIDLAAAACLHIAEKRGLLTGLVQYFDYGRSVPGKLAEWEAHPKMKGNLYNVAWRTDIAEKSRKEFSGEEAPYRPVVRAYSMSFVGMILNAAQDADPSMPLDLHSGPGASPNFTFAAFMDDRPYRRRGDIAVFGILSSSVSAMAAMTNATKAFEQPAPFTYPIYWPEGEGLRKVEPIVTSARMMRTLGADPELAARWKAQLKANDVYFTELAYGAPVLDYSPFMRLVRRTLAMNHINRTKDAVVDGDVYPYPEVLRRMVREFAQVARADGQIPVVMLIQSRDPNDPDVLKIAKPVLDRENIPYFATVDYVDPRNPSFFIPDGHYNKRVNKELGRAFIEMLDKKGLRKATPDAPAAERAPPAE